MLGEPKLELQITFLAAANRNLFQHLSIPARLFATFGEGFGHPIFLAAVLEAVLILVDDDFVFGLSEHLV